MGQYQLLSVLAARLSPLNNDHSSNLPVEICGINYTGKYTKIVNEYDQEIPQSQTADNPVAP